MLCSRCIEASDHEGHNITVTQSDRHKGCCDCGDDEAFELPIKCAIHTVPAQLFRLQTETKKPLPPHVAQSVKTTISVAFDFICDVISCSPEFLRDNVSPETVKADREGAELAEAVYGTEPTLPVNPEQRLIIWNDEKHTHEEVTEQVARACRTTKAFARTRANETDELGRSIVKSSSDVPSLITALHVIEQIRLSVTIRSARDTFREQMCGAIIEWLEDISRCQIGDDHEILQTTICEVLLQDWRRGSKASNALTQRDGLDDHQMDEQILEKTGFPGWQRAAQLEAFRVLRQRTIGAFRNNEIPQLQDLDAMRRNLERVMMRAREVLIAPDDTLIGDTATRVQDARTQIEGLAGGTDNLDDDNLMQVDGFANPMAALEDTVGPFADPDELVAPDPTTITTPPNTAARLASRNMPSSSGSGALLSSSPKHQRSQDPLPDHWRTKPKAPVVPNDDRMRQITARETRLSWLLLFDLRLWKKARIDLRNLYIGTMVAVPEFKRIFSLIFARDYNNLAQLYLVGDREPDNSVVQLSVQLLTTPSIVQDLIDHVDFLSKILALFYTFLTKRQVGPPNKVDLRASIPGEPSSLVNRRLSVYFVDLTSLIAHGYVQSEMARNIVYLKQFLDLLSLLQGIFPNVRAVGEHVEYESESWFSASGVAREFSRLCRKFGKVYKADGESERESLEEAIRYTMGVLSKHCLGQRISRFAQTEIKAAPKFRLLQGNLSHRGHPSIPCSYRVMRYDIATQPMSTFHHLHFLLSWLVEQAKDFTPERLHSVLSEGTYEANELLTDPMAACTSEDILFSVFDFTFRMPAWLAQERAKLWVRNGASLRHQLQAYRSVISRKLTFNRDVLLIQLAFSILEPSRVLATLLNRFSLGHIVEGPPLLPSWLYDPQQEIDVLTDFFQLLISVLTDRIKLHHSGKDDSGRMQLLERDIIHVLCFKPLPFSKLGIELPEKAQTGSDFKELLNKVSDYHEPEGLTDCGMYELKSEYLQDIDPYNANFSKNQREEAELAYRKRMAQLTGRPLETIIYEPKLDPISTGAFTRLPKIIDEPLFAHTIFYALQHYHREAMIQDEKGDMVLAPDAASRLDGLFQTILHLILVATAKVDVIDHSVVGAHFIEQATEAPAQREGRRLSSILESLAYSGRHHPSSKPKIRAIVERFQAHAPNLSIWSDQRYLQRYGIDLIHDPKSMDDSDEAATMARKRAVAAQRKAEVLARMKQQQQAFMATVEADECDDTADLMTIDGSAMESVKLWDFPSGNCILCQEDCDESKGYGIFGMMMKTDVIRETPMDEAEYLHEVLEVAPNLDQLIDRSSAFGVAGRNLAPIAQMKQNGEVVQKLQTRLRKGFPVKNCLRKTALTGCGHVMHGQCFYQYLNAVSKRHKSQIARAHPERLEDRNEFLCPLCKSLNNIFLPVIWKTKQEVYPGILQPEYDLTRYINYELTLLLELHPDSPCNYAESIVDEPKHQAKLMRRMLSDAKSKMFSKISVGIERIASIAAPRSRSLPFYSSPLNPFSQTERGAAPTGPGLDTHYERMRASLIKNDLEEEDSERFNEQSDTTEKFGYHQTLARTLASSIVTVEIAQRGIESRFDSVTFIEKISNQMITTLRVFADTILTYSSVGFAKALRAGSNRPQCANALPTLYFQSQNCALFPGSDAIANLDESLIHTVLGEPTREEMLTGEPLLSKDIFSFMVECMMGTVPAFALDPYHAMHICYMVYVMKITVLLWTNKSKEQVWQLLHDASDGLSTADRSDPERMRAYVAMVEWFKQNDGDSRLGELVVPSIYRIIETYLLTFLRQTALLMYVRFGLDFTLAPAEGLAVEKEGSDDVVMSNAADSDYPAYDPSASELVRLQALLRLPTMSTLMCRLVMSDQVSPYQVSPSTAHQYWTSLPKNVLDHWRRYMEIPDGSLFSQLEDQTLVKQLTLQHPGIPELASLPDVFDVLVSQCMEFTCPATGQPMTDPAVCLLCGQVICTQTRCCTRGGIGPLNQHLRRCGLNVPQKVPSRPYPPYLKWTGSGYGSRSASTSSNPRSSVLVSIPPAAPLTPLPPPAQRGGEEASTGSYFQVGPATDLPTEPSQQPPSLDPPLLRTHYPHQRSPRSRAISKATTLATTSGCKEYGIFMLVRKCSLLYLWGAPNISALAAAHEPDQPGSSSTSAGPAGSPMAGLGTFALAPYLDEHGETDQLLRRHQRLYLNRKRLEGAVRRVWLKGEVASLVARRLDGEMGQGGWESF